MTIALVIEKTTIVSNTQQVVLAQSQSLRKIPSNISLSWKGKALGGILIVMASSERQNSFCKSNLLHFWYDCLLYDCDSSVYDILAQFGINYWN